MMQPTFVNPGAALGAPDGMPTEVDQSNQQQLLRELHARATAQAARAVGLSPAAALAAAGVPLLQGLSNGAPTAEAQYQQQAQLMQQPQMPGVGEAAAMVHPMQMPQGAAAAVSVAAASLPTCSAIMPAAGTALVAQQQQMVLTTDGGESDFTCTVCRKVFKREMNLVFHMTTHRPKQPKAEGEGEGAMEPVTCQDCGKTFGTKYQAKKHYLRRHFRGERPFGCNKCGKRFVVREDLTMHVKSCGNVYACSCGIRLCSLGALKRHCRHFSHEPASLDPQLQIAGGLLSHSMVQAQPGAPVAPRAIDQLTYGQLASQFGPRGAASMLSMRPGHATPMTHVLSNQSAMGGMAAFPSADAFGFNCLSAAVHQQPMAAQQNPEHANMLVHATGQGSCALNLMAGAVASRCAD
eukprot:CAMPEP_0119355750 /NCGR_PEP_ID=MMETSP1334-20130426/4538_1 /TAXON_ID=127549 /ORGANISM="Calcidiscus leptoporus, Strain RCC1130" /LENGTH=407 /DNA_ID=CAMNT_0007369655 /DNA_START=69 /DNA_END=1289 /DNA_ORIENTATION=+